MKGFKPGLKERGGDGILRIISITVRSITTVQNGHVCVACTASDLFQCPQIELCLHSAYVCDGVNDCTDWSDELNCSQSLHVQPSASQAQLSMGPFRVTRSNPTHQLTDPTWLSPNHGSTHPMDSSDLTPTWTELTQIKPNSTIDSGLRQRPLGSCESPTSPRTLSGRVGSVYMVGVTSGARDAKRARDNHALAYNFAKYSPINFLSQLQE